MTIELKSFDTLHINELYSILRLRSEVFVVEQDCPYQDLDNNDQNSYHVICLSEVGKLIGYARLLSRGMTYADYASIGRVVVSKEARGLNVGRKLMQYAIEKCSALFPKEPVKISAQHHLQTWYESLGFEAVGDVYLEDNIPHIGMILNIQKV